MEHTNILNPFYTERSFSVAIENQELMSSPASIFAIEDEFQDVISVTRIIEAETLEQAHYLCMNLGYTISGCDELLKTSHYAEFAGMHEAGSLIEAYEKAIGKKDIKSA